MRDNTSVEVERHEKLEIVYITMCPCCHSTISFAEKIKDNTRAIYRPCRLCGSFLRLDLITGISQIIRKGNKKCVN